MARPFTRNRATRDPRAPAVRPSRTAHSLRACTTSCEEPGCSASARRPVSCPGAASLRAGGGDVQRVAQPLRIRFRERQTRQRGGQHTPDRRVRGRPGGRPQGFREDRTGAHGGTGGVTAVPPPLPGPRAFCTGPGRASGGRPGPSARPSARATGTGIGIGTDTAPALARPADGRRAGGGRWRAGAGPPRGARCAPRLSAPPPPRPAYWPTRPGWRTLVNSTPPSTSRSRTVISPLSPSISTSP